MNFSRVTTEDLLELLNGLTIDLADMDTVRAYLTQQMKDVQMELRRRKAGTSDDAGDWRELAKSVE